MCRFYEACINADQAMGPTVDAALRAFVVSEQDWRLGSEAVKRPNLESVDIAAWLAVHDDIASTYWAREDLTAERIRSGVTPRR